MILFVAGVIAIIFLAVLADKFFEKKHTADVRYPTAEFHSKNGYTITYPKDWIVDDPQRGASAEEESIREANGRAFFSMEAHTDARLMKADERSQAYKEIEESFRNDPRYVVEKSGWESDDKTTAENSFFAAGSYVDDGKPWKFKELSISAKNGVVLVLRGMAREEYADEYFPLIDAMFASVQLDGLKATVGIGEEQALGTIKNLPEVREYQGMLEEAGKKALFEAEDGDNVWNVHVFEIVREDGGSSHTATFEWYRVDKKTGAVEIGL